MISAFFMIYAVFPTHVGMNQIRVDGVDILSAYSPHTWG